MFAMASKDAGLRLSQNEIDDAFRDPKWAELYPPVLTVDQAAAMLQVPKDTLYAWSSCGKLKGCARRMGKHLRLFRNRLLQHVFNEGLNDDE